MASVALAIAATLLSAAGASADEPGSPRERAQELQAENADLAGRERSAVLELYALESHLAQADRRVDALKSAAAEAERERAATERRLELVRQSLAAAEAGLAEHLRALYVEGNPDPLELLLGAQSLDEALTALDSLGRFARHDQEIVLDVQAARRAVTEVLSELTEEEAELARLTGEAEDARDGLVAAQTQQASYVAGLRGEQRLNGAEVADLLSAAEAAEERSQELDPAPPADSSPPPPSSSPSPPSSPTAAPDGSKLTVVATGYAIHGTTATGIPTGWGVVAVDPAVIPLGTRMTIPGYGEGVAADTGSAVQGNIIDLWFPTRAQALAWGRRTVTITLH